VAVLGGVLTAAVLVVDRRVLLALTTAARVGVVVLKALVVPQVPLALAAVRVTRVRHSKAALPPLRLRVSLAEAVAAIMAEVRVVLLAAVALVVGAGLAILIPICFLLALLLLVLRG
jgi:hypothetical protein